MKRFLLVESKNGLKSQISEGKQFFSLWNTKKIVLTEIICLKVFF